MKPTLDIVGVGIDVVEIPDVKGIRFKKRFAEYFLTREEIKHIPKGLREIPFLASRFAIKEAVIKAFPGKLKPHDFTIEKKGMRPCVVFFSKKHIMRYTVHISLSHTKHIATAFAIVVQCSV